MNDKFTRGFLAGLIGRVVMNLLNLLFVYIFNFGKCLDLDWAAVMLYGNKATDFAEVVIALIAQIVFTGFLSILFAPLILLIDSKNYWFKGWLFGVLCWVLYLCRIHPFESDGVRAPFGGNSDFVLYHRLDLWNYSGGSA